MAAEADRARLGAVALGEPVGLVFALRSGERVGLGGHEPDHHLELDRGRRGGRALARVAGERREMPVDPLKSVAGSGRDGLFRPARRSAARRLVRAGQWHVSIPSGAPASTVVHYSRRTPSSPASTTRHQASRSRPFGARSSCRACRPRHRSMSGCSGYFGGRRSRSRCGLNRPVNATRYQCR